MIYPISLFSKIHQRILKFITKIVPSEIMKMRKEYRKLYCKCYVPGQVRKHIGLVTIPLAITTSL